jgi:hypothetical protein
LFADRVDFSILFVSRPLIKRKPALRILAGPAFVVPLGLGFREKSAAESFSHTPDWLADNGVSFKLGAMLLFKKGSALSLVSDFVLVPTMYGSARNGALHFPQEAVSVALQYSYFLLR